MANSSTRGLHTLVEGLTLSPSSPANSPSASASTSTTPGPPPAYNPSSSSIFNNPGTNSPSETPNPASSSASAGSYSNAGARVSSFGSRRLNYSSRQASGSGVALASGSGTSGNGSETPAVKEVDDPTTPISSTVFDKMPAAPNTLSRLFSTTPTPQQGGGYSLQGRSYSYRGSDSVKLEEFLYTRGFLEGACSDVTILAFGARYPLHRLILDRSPFFSSCFNGGPWLESTSSEISLSPEVSDPNITQHSFELALARLYGHLDRPEEDRHALPLLAAASFLDLQDLAESCVSSLLRHLTTSNISTVVKFVTNSYYGPLTDRLLESAKALLYRDGWEMDMAEWDGISGEVAADIVGYDGFYVPSEWLRYCFVKEMVDWRISHSYSYHLEHPNSENGFEGQEEELGEKEREEAREDDEADLKPLKDLLEHGIYYVHMSFEELQKIAEDRDVLGRRTVSEGTIREALWQQVLLRQKVVNAPLSSPELGITEMETVSCKTPERMPTPRIGEKMSQNSMMPWTPIPADPTVSALDAPATPIKKYYIPTEDTTTVIGDCPDQQQHVVVSQPGPRGNPSASRPAEPTFTPSGATEDGKVTASAASLPAEETRFSSFPPFRFSAEFRSVRSLKEKKRVYSKTVFYAGSHWNIYIQKVRSSKNVQLGVYLHRAKDRESAGHSSANRDGEGVGQVITVDDRLGMSDRDINSRHSASSAAGDDVGDLTTTTIGDGDVTGTNFTPSARQNANTSATRSHHLGNISGSVAGTSEGSVPAVPYYVDSRPMIQTYFKIFSPSRKGKMLSMFSSGPDSFNFSQSWGWKSSSLILEEGLVSEDKDARLRFMVVLGNV